MPGRATASASQTACWKLRRTPSGSPAPWWWPTTGINAWTMPVSAM